MTIKTARNIATGSQRQWGTRSIPSWLPISLLMVFSAALFFYRLDGEGLWLDELTSVEDSSLAPWAAFKENQLRPLYYFLLMGWMRLGSGDAWLRSLSVIFALISVFLVYRLGRRLSGEATGLLAALMLAVSPSFLNHTQEIRMYVLSLCLGVAGSLCLANILLIERSKKPEQKPEQKSEQKFFAGWALFRLLAIYTVPLNVTLLLPDVLMIWLRFRKERSVLFNAAKWLLLLGLLWIPALQSVIAEASPSSSYASHHASAQPPSIAALIRPLKFLTVWPFAVQENAIVALFYKLFTPLLVALAAAGLIRKHRSPALFWAFAWLILPVLPIIAFSYLSVPIWVNRYLLFVSPYLFILLAAGFVRLWQQWRIAAVVMATLYLLAVSGGVVHHYTSQERPDYKFNIATIEQYEQPGDAVVWGYYYTKPLRYYYDGQSEVYPLSVRDVETPEDVQAWIAALPVERDRIWLAGEGSEITEPIESEIRKLYSIEQTFDYERGSKVMLLNRLDLT